MLKQVSEGFLVNSRGLKKLRGFSEKKRVLLYFFERLRALGQECRGSGAEGFFCKLTTQLTGIYGRQQLDLDRTVRTRSGIWIVRWRSDVPDHGVSGCAHRGTWRLRTSTRVGNRVRAHGCAPSLWTRCGTGPATLWGSGSGGRCPQSSGGAF